MWRWCVGLGLILLVNLLAVGYWHYDDGLQESFENLDTRVVLQRLQQPHRVWDWFTGDWVLGNGFYRPLPSLLYQGDYWLWGDDLLAWKWTNGLLATLNALLVVGFAWALMGRRDLALGTGLAFSCWQTGFYLSLPLWVGWLALGVGAFWGWRVGDFRRGLLWGCLACTLVIEWRFVPTLPDIHGQSFAYRAVGWIPGRTATLMTLFALLALTGACLYGRTGATRWALLGLLGFLGALMSHEQAVVLPLLMALAGWAGWQTPAASRLASQRLPRFLLLPLLCLLLLIPYGMFYRARIPTDTAYHQQRLKRFKTMPAAALYWLVPTAPDSLLQLDIARVAPTAMMLPEFWQAHLGLVVYLVALRGGLRTRPGWVGWLGSVLAYAPLMPVLPLMHYYYLPAVFRALWVGILWACLLMLRPTSGATSVATGDAMCPKRSFPLWKSSPKRTSTTKTTPIFSVN